MLNSTAKAPTFSGHAMISPALWIRSASASSTSNGVLASIPVSSSKSSSMNSRLSFTTTGFIPVELPTFSCSTVPFSCSSVGAQPSSWLNSFRSSWVISPLSTPTGQTCAHRRHMVHRYASSYSRVTVAQFSSMSSPFSFASALPPRFAYFRYNRRRISDRNVGL